MVPDQKRRVLHYTMRKLHVKRAERLPAAFKVEMSWQEIVAQLLTRDISDTGIFLAAERGSYPPIGTVVKVRLQGNLGCGEEPPTLSMRIVREADDGIGLMFVDERDE